VDVPSEVVRICKALFDLRGTGAVGAVLVSDRVIGTDHGQVRLLRYATPDDSLVVRADYVPHTCELQVRCHPPLSCTLVIDQRGRPPGVQAVQAGVAPSATLSGGWTSLLLDRSSEFGGRVRTAWTKL